MIHRLFILTLLFVPHFAMAEIYISEIAWMGNSESANYEWIELYSTESISLDGWSLSALDGVPSISLEGQIQGTFLLERSESSLPSTADILYSGALENGGEVLILTDVEGVEIYRVDGSSSWSSIGGDNTSKETAQYVLGAWKTAVPTPGVVEVATAAEDTTIETGGSTSYVKPKLSLTVPDSMNIVAGSEVVFHAQVGDTAGTYFDSALVSWNFGDGSSVQGNNMYHKYEYPGVYVARVHALYGREEISKRVIVTVRSSNVVFSFKDKQSVHIKNIDTEELDISRWRIIDGANMFQFPGHTYILPEGSLMLSHLVSGFEFSEDVQLTYSDGKKVSEIEVVEEKVQYVPVYREEVAEEVPEKIKEEEVSHAASAYIANESTEGLSVWIYAWIVLVLAVGGSIVYIRKYV